MATIIGITGVVLYLLTGFIYLSSGLVVPAPWLFILWGIWIAGLYLLVTVYRARPMWTPAVPVGAVVVWWVYLMVGEAVLGWTA